MSESLATYHVSRPVRLVATAPRCERQVRAQTLYGVDLGGYHSCDRAAAFVQRFDRGERRLCSDCAIELRRAVSGVGGIVPLAEAL